MKEHCNKTKTKVGMVKGGKIYMNKVNIKIIFLRNRQKNKEYSIIQ